MKEKDMVSKVAAKKRMEFNDIITSIHDSIELNQEMELVDSLRDLNNFIINIHLAMPRTIYEFMPRIKAILNECVNYRALSDKEAIIQKIEYVSCKAADVDYIVDVYREVIAIII